MNLEKIGEIWEYFGGIHANPRTGSIDARLTKFCCVILLKTELVQYIHPGVVLRIDDLGSHAMNV